MFIVLDQNGAISAANQFDFEQWCSLVSSHYGESADASVLVPPHPRPDVIMLQPVIFSDHAGMLFNKTKKGGQRAASLWTVARDIIGCENAQVVSGVYASIADICQMIEAYLSTRGAGG